MNCFRVTALTIVISALAACGGGGSGSGTGFTEVPSGAPADATRTTAEGLWLGTTMDGRGAQLLVLDNGSYWVLYSMPPSGGVLFPPGVLLPPLAPNEQIAGFMQGSGVSAPATPTSSYSGSGTDFNFEGFGINPVTLAADYTPQQTIDGVVTYPTLSGSLSFNLVHDDAYESAAVLSQAAGNYVGEGRPADTGTGVLEPVAFSVLASGLITGSATDSGCTFSGTFAPRARGNVFNISIRFDALTCGDDLGSTAGVALFDASTASLTGMALNSARTDGFVFTGTRR